MDAFERFGLGRRLDFTAGEVENTVNRKLEASHPDRGGEEGDFESLKTEADLLGSPYGRLTLALAYLGIDASERGNVPDEVMDCFSPVADILQRVEEFVRERKKAVSLLGKAVLDGRVPELKADLERIVSRLSAMEEAIYEEFPRFDQEGWENNVEELARSHRALSFLRKWLAQLREATGKIFEALLAGS